MKWSVPVGFTVGSSVMKWSVPVGSSGKLKSRGSFMKWSVPVGFGRFVCRFMYEVVCPRRFSPSVLPVGSPRRFMSRERLGWQRGKNWRPKAARSWKIGRMTAAALVTVVATNCRG